MSQRALMPAVLLAAASILAFHIGQAGIAGGMLDPVGGIRPQDEAVYSHTAIQMAHGSDWLTPKFLGRYALYKPPLLYWLSGASVKLFGVSPFTLRLPNLIAAALVCLLVFRWLAQARHVVAASAAVLLLLSDRLWHTLARLNLTDMLVTACFAVTMYVLFRDPSLKGVASFWTFAIAVAGAIMSKGIAGLLPLLALYAFWLIAGKSDRPSFQSTVIVTFAAALLAAPWHLYQLLAHGRWFWTEYVLAEQFLFGVASPYQTTQENQAWFYARRLWAMDPVLCLVAFLAVPAWIGAIRKRQASSLVLLVWIGVTIFSVLAFQYRNVAYLLPLIPPLVMLAAGYGPWCGSKAAALAACVLLSLVFVIKTSHQEQFWGLPYGPQSAPSAQALESYRGMQRNRELVIVAPDDEFYSTLLPIRQVRFAYLIPSEQRVSTPLDFREMGIIVTASEFNQLDRLMPLFARRLRAWGLDSTAPVASVIEVRSEAELSDLIARHAETDFFLPREFRAAAAAVGDRQIVEAPGRFFLLAGPTTPP